MFARMSKQRARVRGVTVTVAHDDPDQYLDKIEKKKTVKMATATVPDVSAELAHSEEDAAFCGHCKTMVNEGIECGSCKKWYHYDKECSSLEDATNEVLRNKQVIYVCHLCYSDELNIYCGVSDKLARLKEEVKEMHEFIGSFVETQTEVISKKTDGLQLSTDELNKKTERYGDENKMNSTYASKLKSKNTLVIKSTEDTTRAADSRKTIMSKISTLVEEVKTTKQGHLVVNFADKVRLEGAKNDIEKVKEDIKVTVDQKEMLRPKIKVCDVDKDDENVLDSIMIKNEWITTLINNEDDFKVIKYMNSKQENKVHYIIKCTPEIRRAIRNNGDRVYTLYGRNKVFDTYMAYQCYKCQDFGHSAKKCTKTQVCAKCGQNHRLNECQETAEKCHNCVKKGHSDISHRTYGSKCPVYNEEISRIKNRTDHGF